MERKSLIILVVLAVVVVAIAAIALAAGDGDDKTPRTVDHSLDTNQTIELTWSFLDGFDESYRFITTNESYGSSMDNDDDGWFGSYTHKVKITSGELPPGITLTVNHDGLSFWGYEWHFDGSCNTSGTWSGTATYTVDDDSEYDGTVHTLHFTLTKP